jgi:hypothetical protein
MAHANVASSVVVVQMVAVVWRLPATPWWRLVVRTIYFLFCEDAGKTHLFLG